MHTNMMRISRSKKRAIAEIIQQQQEIRQCVEETKQQIDADKRKADPKTYWKETDARKASSISEALYQRFLKSAGLQCDASHAPLPVTMQHVWEDRERLIQQYELLNLAVRAVYVQMDKMRCDDAYDVLQDLKAVVQASRDRTIPHVVCTSCGGMRGECKECNHKGWWTKAEYDAKKNCATKPGRKTIRAFA